jgi:hypothetical protein
MRGALSEHAWLEAEFVGLVQSKVADSCVLHGKT